MKSFNLLKIPAMLALGFGAMLLFAPSSRAQAEVAPDHYDNEAFSAPAKPKQPSASVAQKQRKGELATTLSPAAADNSPASQRGELVAVQDKRKASSTKSAPR